MLVDLSTLRTHPSYFTCFLKGNLALNFARSSGTHSSTWYDETWRYSGEQPWRYLATVCQYPDSVYIYATINVMHLYRWRQDDAKWRNSVWVINRQRTRCHEHVRTVAVTQACLLRLPQVRCYTCFPAIWSVRCSSYARLLILATCVYSLFVDVRCTTQCLLSKVASARTERRTYK
jgi:hypothetical protein